jgi:hypothetical protein
MKTTGINKKSQHMCKNINETTLSRRKFLLSSAVMGTTLAFGFNAMSIGNNSKVEIIQLIYAGGNWQPRHGALRRLSWEIHKRTAIDMILEPTSVKPIKRLLAKSPVAYISGDRPFPPFEDRYIKALTRYLRLGGTLIVDPAYTEGGNGPGFLQSIDRLIKSVLPDIPKTKIGTEHVIFRSFYKLSRAVGKRRGTPDLSGYAIGNRIAVIIGDHDMAGAWARNNLGQWEHEVTPGGERQRENAFRLGINLIMYAICQDYKNEQPHRQIGIPAP